MGRAASCATRCSRHRLVSFHFPGSLQPSCVSGIERLCRVETVDRGVTSRARHMWSREDGSRRAFRVGAHFMYTRDARRLATCDLRNWLPAASKLPASHRDLKRRELRDVSPVTCHHLHLDKDRNQRLKRSSSAGVPSNFHESFPNTSAGHLEERSKANTVNTFSLYHRTTALVVGETLTLTLTLTSLQPERGLDQ